MVNKILLFLFIILSVTWAVILSSDEKNLQLVKSRLEREYTSASTADFSIKITKKKMWLLEDMVRKSKANHFLLESSKKWIPCLVYRQGISYKCQIRIRGDLPKHWTGVKRSYRIKFKTPSPFWGWKKVDLILPEDKGQEAEVVAYRISKKLGLIAPEARFGTISMNGINLGAYLIRQSDSGSLFEMNGRTESQLIKENNIWWYAQNAGGIYNPLFWKGEEDRTNLRLLPIIYETFFNGEAASELTFSRFAQFLTLVSKGKELNQHLDLKSFYSWLAVAMTFGSIHSTLPDNLYWYMNASTGLAEPVIYDVLPSRLGSDPFEIFKKKSYLIRKILEVSWSEYKVFFFQEVSTIQKIYKPIYLKVISERNSISNPMLRSDEDYFEAQAHERLKMLKDNIESMQGNRSHDD